MHREKAWRLQFGLNRRAGCADIPDGHPNPFLPMNAFIRILAGSLALCASGLVRAESKVNVQGSSELRLAVVDSNRSNASSDALHAAFAASLEEAINVNGGAPVTVKTKRVNADHAAFNLGTGVYDAVLVMGNTVPRPLILSETKRLLATLNSGKGEKKAFLIFGVSDEGLAKALTAAFTPAITNTKFLDALDGGLEKLATVPEGGAKVAARP